MNIPEVVKIISTILFAGIGWFIVHLLNKRRDLINEKRKMHLQYLLEAYRSISNAANRNNYDKNSIESAVQDVQLLGSNKQIEVLHNLMSDHEKGLPLDFSKLLIELRNELRVELNLKKVEESKTIKFLRMK